MPSLGDPSGGLPMKPKMSLMVGTKMTRALVPPSKTSVMMQWRIQLKSLDAHRSWLTEVRICRQRKKKNNASEQTHLVNGGRAATPRSSSDFATYREKHHGDGEGDGGQHGQADDQQDHVGLEYLGVGVQHLGLHVYCGENGRGLLATPR